VLDVIIKLLPADTKKKALEDLCRLTAPIAQLDQMLICRAIFERERLGSTGIGFGVAVPHARLPELSKTVCAFAMLAHPVDFDAIDGERVDLLFFLLSPEASNEVHLRTIAKASRVLRDSSMRQLLRSAPDDNAVRNIFGDA
jgi:PTS system nitrogen regulatory IIA component